MARKIDDTLTCLIDMNAKNAADAYEAAKTEMADAFATNPVYAIEWKAEAVVKTQTKYLFWATVAKVSARDGERAAVEEAEDIIDRELSSFFGSNSTCNYHNAIERSKATVIHDLRRSVREMRKRLPAA
jgi:hypothetical protein